jgi:hypothetical protein
MLMMVFSQLLSAQTSETPINSSSVQINGWLKWHASLDCLLDLLLINLLIPLYHTLMQIKYGMTEEVSPTSY